MYFSAEADDGWPLAPLPLEAIEQHFADSRRLPQLEVDYIEESGTKMKWPRLLKVNPDTGRGPVEPLLRAFYPRARIPPAKPRRSKAMLVRDDLGWKEERVEYVGRLDLEDFPILAPAGRVIGRKLRSGWGCAIWTKSPVTRGNSPGPSSASVSRRLPYMWRMPGCCS